MAPAQGKQLSDSAPFKLLCDDVTAVSHLPVVVTPGTPHKNDVKPRKPPNSLTSTKMLNRARM
jgi:hypothetical protein